MYVHKEVLNDPKQVESILTNLGMSKSQLEKEKKEWSERVKRIVRQACSDFEKDHEVHETAEGAGVFKYYKSHVEGHDCEIVYDVMTKILSLSISKQKGHKHHLIIMQVQYYFQNGMWFGTVPKDMKLLSGTKELLRQIRRGKYDAGKLWGDIHLRR